MTTVTILGHVAEKGSKAASLLLKAERFYRAASLHDSRGCPSLACIQRMEGKDRINLATAARGYVGRAKETP